MNIWVDANGWPIPPIVLLGCLAAEILYFRGWRVLVKAEQRKTASATTASVLTGSGGYQWNSWLWRGAYFLGAIFFILLGDSAPIDILSGRLFWVHMIQHLFLLVVIAPLLVASSSAVTVVAGITGLGAQARQGTGKIESRSCFLLAEALAAAARHLVRAPDRRDLGVALACPLRSCADKRGHPRLV